MLTDHTPTPWQVEEYNVPLGAGHYHVIGNHDHEIAYAPWMKDAAHIVRCVNSHEALKNAVTALVFALRSYQFGNSAPALADEVIANAETALAQADEKGATHVD